MAKYINKEELIKECNYIVRWEDDKETFGISEARIDLMPTIDIVHCKECKHSNVDKMGWYCNKHYHRYADENTHFCSDGGENLYKEEKPKLSARLIQMKSILIEFTKLWARHKELRFGQVIALIQMECESDDLFYVNDNTILYKLKTRDEEERNSK